LPRPPNYSHERKERDRIKAAKKAEKLAAKTAGRSVNSPSQEVVDTDPKEAES